MAGSKVMSLAADTWTDLTGADITANVTVIHRGGGEVLLEFGDAGGGDEPAATVVTGLPIGTGRDGLPNGFLKKALTDLCMDVVTPVRVYGRAMGLGAHIFIEWD